MEKSPLSDKSDEGHVRPDFTVGSISQNVIKLAFYSMLAMLFHYSYSFIDMLWLGWIGKDAIAAVGAYAQFMMLLVIFNQMVAMGSLTLISRSYGAKNYEETSTVIGQTFTFKILLIAPWVVLGWFFIYDALIWYGATQNVAALGAQYGRIMLPAMPLYFSGFTLATGFRSIGDVKKPMILAGFTMGLNIFLDWQLIYVYGLGVRGAAIASITSQIIFFIAALYIFFAGHTFVRLRLRHLLRPSFYWVKKFIRIGSPAVVGDACRFSAMFIVGKVIIGFGTGAFAAYTIGGRLFELSWIPLFGLNTAVSALVGQNLGAAKPGRAEKTVLWGTFAGLGIIAVIAALALMFAPYFIRIFTSDFQVVHTGANLVRFGAFALLFISIGMGLGAAFWGSGHNLPLAIVSAVSLWGVQIPLIYIFVKRLDLTVSYVWLSMVIAEAVGAFLTIYLFSRGGWKRKKV
jgi:putative MATE family efflux protein